MAFKQIKNCDLSFKEKWCRSCLVTYPVSYRYNGGTIIDGEWYNGYHVPPPKVPKGFTLMDIGIGLQLNARPPIATVYLKPDNDRKVSKGEVLQALAEL